MAQTEGKVYILGAGLGTVDFLTVGGQAILSTTEVLIYDALIDPQLLTLTPKTCIHLWVGKRGQQPSTPQSEINQLLINYCHQGKQVVRLKSGDPGIFGRVASEIQALRAANCSYEVWPGLSSAIAAPLLAGIPLTDPLLSRSVTLVSAHEPAALDWELMVRSETLVVLMGGRSLPTFIDSLQAHGKSAQTPIAIIKWGGSLQQQIWVGTLENILSQTQGELLSPTVMVIGPVVELRDTLALPVISARNSCVLPLPMTTFPLSAQQPLPLAGLTILVTRSAGQAPTFRKSLEAQGAMVLEMAALEIGPPSSWDALDSAIAQIETFDWLFLTSANGVDYFFERLFAQGKDARALAGVNIAVVGRKTASSLAARGLTPDFIPPNYIADALVEHFPDRETLHNQRCLFPRVESGGREVLVQELTAGGATVVEVPAYQSQCPTAMEPQILAALQQQTIDVITFASSKTVEYFWQLLHQPPTDQLDWHQILQPIQLASIGPQTSKTCHTLLGRVNMEAKEYTLDGLIESIVQAHIDFASSQ